MCIGVPMRVHAPGAGHAWCVREGDAAGQWVETALVGEVAAGDWLLVFLDSARERIDAVRAAEVSATLRLLEAALAGAPLADDPGFELPSARDPRSFAGVAPASLTSPSSPSSPSDQPT